MYVSSLETLRSESPTPAGPPGFWDADAQAFVPAEPSLGVFSERIRSAVAAAEQLLAAAEADEGAGMLAKDLRSIEMHSTLSQELLVTSAVR